MALTVFYILYVLIDVPSNWLLKIVGGGHYLPLLAMAWGIVGTCTGAVKSYGGLIACRMFLGACEGGMFGGIILYFSMFYKRHELMFRLGIFYCAAPLSVWQSTLLIHLQPALDSNNSDLGSLWRVARYWARSY